MSASVAVVPAVATLFFLVIQISLWFYGRSVTTAAAEHGLNAARVHRGAEQGADHRAGEVAVEEFIDQVGGVGSHSVTVDQRGATVTVTIHADPITVLPFFHKPIDVTVEAPLEELTE